jgi:hypothetical protein
MLWKGFVGLVNLQYGKPNVAHGSKTAARTIGAAAIPQPAQLVDATLGASWQ